MSNQLYERMLFGEQKRMEREWEKEMAFSLKCGKIL